MSSYAKAKTTFETVIQKMQRDIQTYAASGKANQHAVNIRLEMINQLVEYYQEAQKHIEELELMHMEQYLTWSKLHTATQMLADWCTLHHVNPKPVLLYKPEELKELIYKGRRFGRIGDYELPDETIEEIKAGSKKVVDFINDQNKYLENYRACL